MFVTLNPKYNYNQPTKSGWNLLPSLFTERGEKVLGIGKNKLYKFYSEYLKFNPDLIIVEWPPACFLVPLFKKIGLIKCPIILNWGDYYSDMMSNSIKHPRFLVRSMENYAAKNADYITTVSKYLESKAIKEFGRIKDKEVFYIPHGFFESNKKSKINLEKLKIKKRNLKIIYLGEQSLYKKVDELIRAVEGLNCDLFLFGKPNPEFQKIASQNVHFMGYVLELEVRSVLKQADILVNTSNQDCNYKLSEYISIGKPLLAYDGLPANIFTHKENAYLTRDFREGIIELIKNKKLRKKLENNIKKLRVFNWEQITEMYITLYNQIISKKLK